MAYRLSFQPLGETRPPAPDVWTSWKPEGLVSILLHVVALAAFLYGGTLTPVKKNDVVWINLDNVYLPTKILPQEIPKADPKPPEPVSMAPPSIPDLPELPAEPLPPAPQPLSTSEKIASAVARIQPAKIKQHKAKDPKVNDPVKPEPNVAQQPIKPIQAQPEKIVATPTKPVSTLSHHQQAPPSGESATQVAARVEQGYLQEHLDTIRRKVLDNLHYPTMARRQGWTGKVQVRFNILLTGTIERAEVISSSGFDLLDRKALEAVASAAPFPRPPAITTITIPVAFQLK